MKLRVVVEVVDEQKGVRRKKDILIPKNTIKTYSILSENRDQIRSLIADDIISNIVRHLMNRPERLDEAVKGGSSEQYFSKINDLLGLDIIDHMDKQNLKE